MLTAPMKNPPWPLPGSRAPAPPAVPSAEAHDVSARIDAVAAGALFAGRAKIACLAAELFEQPHLGPLPTARAIAGSPEVARRMIAVANTVKYGAGIPVTNLEAATVRLGADRARAVAVSRLIGDILAATAPAELRFDSFWRGCLVRGCLARALAMNAQPGLAGEAMLVGMLQDVGMAPLAALDPAAYAEIIQQSDESQLRLAILEWRSFNMNHVHVGLRLMTGWYMPTLVVEAVGRHHTNPPLGPTSDPAIRLWQIGYLVGTLPVEPSRTPAQPDATAIRLLETAFQIGPDRIGRLLQQAAEEFEDVSGMFDACVAAGGAPCDLLAPAAAALGAGPARLTGGSPVFTGHDSHEQHQRCDDPAANREALAHADAVSVL